MTRLSRIAAAAALAATLLGVPATAPAQSQNANDLETFGPPPEPPADNSGSPLPGYLAFGAMAGLGIFIICKSSRR